MPWTRRWIWRWGIASHSWCNAADSSAKVWTGRYLGRTRRPRMSNKFSIGLRSGHGTAVITVHFKKSITLRVRWGLTLESIHTGLVTKAWLSKWGTTTVFRTTLWYLGPFNLLWTRSNTQSCETHPHTITESPPNGMVSWILLAYGRHGRYIYTYIHTYIHTYRYAHTYTHTLSLSLSLSHTHIHTQTKTDTQFKNMNINIHIMYG